MSAPPTVLVLAGGPDPEHDVSLDSARCIADALNAGDRFCAHLHEFNRIDAPALAELPGEIVFPALHGKFGEGGAMQRLLEADGRPFVGSGSAASELAIDKVESKRLASRIVPADGTSCVRISESSVFDPSDAAPPLAFPCVLKPMFEGSTIGLHICRDDASWERAHSATKESGRDAMAEPFIAGREITVGMIDKGQGLIALPIIEITPKDGLYDYDAKYTRADTAYNMHPDIPDQLSADLNAFCDALVLRMGVRDLARIDFILDTKNDAHFLEINTMPGFTGHSLVPMACANLGMTGLCELLVERALSRPTLHNQPKAVER